MPAAGSIGSAKLARSMMLSPSNPQNDDAPAESEARRPQRGLGRCVSAHNRAVRTASCCGKRAHLLS